MLAGIMSLCWKSSIIPRIQTTEDEQISLLKSHNCLGKINFLLYIILPTKTVDLHNICDLCLKTVVHATKLSFKFISID